MDFLDPKKKRAHRTRLFIGYGLMVILIAIGSMFLLFEASGFDVNPRTGEVIHNGMVFVDAQPATAEVYLNDEHKGRTDMRLIIPEDRYKLELRRNGYKPWRKTFMLNGSTIERFVYPLLIPETLKPQDSHLYGAAPTLATQSPDRRWLVLQHGGDLAQLEVIDLSTPRAEAKAVALPQGLFTAGATHLLEEVEWSSDNKHVLLKHTFDGKTEFVVIDHTASQNSINLNKIFTVPFTHVSLFDKKPDQFHLFNQADGLLRQGNSRNRQIANILTNVITYKSHGEDVIMYVTEDGAEAGTADVRLKEKDNTYKLRSLKKDARYLLDLARFDNKWYITAGSPAENKIYIYSDPFTVLRNPTNLVKIPVPVAVFRAERQDYLSFSANTRFIALQSGDRMFVYDAETDRTHRYDHDVKLAAGQKVAWMDGHRFAMISENKTVIFDYDGTNRHELVNASNAFLPFFDMDYDNMFTLSPSTVVPGRTALVRTSLLAE